MMVVFKVVVMVVWMVVPMVVLSSDCASNSGDNKLSVAIVCV